MVHVIRLAVGVLAITLLYGCTPTLGLNPEPKTDGLPQVTKYPLHAGVYYSPQFADQEYHRIAGPNTWVVPIGPASVRLFDDIYPRVFEKTSRISKLSADEISAKQIDVVIAPSLQHFDFLLGMDSDSERYSITYRTTLYTDRGVPVASWLVSGKERDKSSFGITGYVEDNMIDAAAKFLQGFERNAGPALTAIAKRSKEQTIPVDPRSVVLTAKRTELPNLDPNVTTALRDAGLVAIRLTAQSTTDRRLVMRASDTRLQLKDGLVVEPATVSAVLSVLDQTSQSGIMVGALINPIIGLLVGMSEQHSQQEERELQSMAVIRTLFRDRMLSKGKEETGIVSFLVPKGTAAAGGMTLTAWIVDPVAADGAQIAVAIPGFGKPQKGTPEPTRGVVKQTDERPAGVDSGPAIGIPIPEFRKPSKDAAAATKGVAQGTNESPSEKPIRKDIEQTPTPSDSPFPPATNPYHEWNESTLPR